MPFRRPIFDIPVVARDNDRIGFDVHLRDDAAPKFIHLTQHRENVRAVLFVPYNVGRGVLERGEIKLLREPHQIFARDARRDERHERAAFDPIAIAHRQPADGFAARADETPIAWVPPPPLFETAEAQTPRILTDYLLGPRVIAGNLVKSGVLIIVRDAQGNSIVTVSGAAKHYGADGFEAPLTDDGAYYVKFDGVELDVKLENETVFITSSGIDHSETRDVTGHSAHKVNQYRSAQGPGKKVPVSD